MKVAFVISSLGIGGAERVLVNMANYWAERGNDVTLVSMDSPDAPAFHVLNERVRLISLNLLANSANPVQAIRQTVGRIRAIRQTMCAIRPDVIISFMDRMNVLTLFASRRLGIPTIVSDRVDPACPNIGRAWNALRTISYRYASALVLQTARFKPFYAPKIQSRIFEVPNPISKLVRSCAPGTLQGREEIVISMGRLVDYKSFDVIINAFAEVADKNPAWKLHMYGQGPEKESLQALIDEKGLSSRIKMMGVTDEPLVKMSEASIFALASVAEGIPNVLIEAMAMGCAVVSTDVGGVPDVVVDGKDGLIVPMGDRAALSRALGLLMSDPELRLSIGRNAVAIRDRLSEDRIMGMWEEVVRSVTAGHKEMLR